MQSAKTTRIMSIGWPSRTVSLNLRLYSLFWFLHVVVDGRLYDVRFLYTTVFSLRLTSSLFKILNCLLLILQLIRLDTAHLRVPSGCRWLTNSNAFLELVHLDECLLASRLAISSESHLRVSSVLAIKRTVHLSLIVDALESAERLFKIYQYSWLDVSSHMMYTYIRGLSLSRFMLICFGMFLNPNGPVLDPSR